MHAHNARRQEVGSIAVRCPFSASWTRAICEVSADAMPSLRLSEAFALNVRCHHSPQEALKWRWQTPLRLAGAARALMSFSVRWQSLQHTSLFLDPTVLGRCKRLRSRRLTGRGHPSPPLSHGPYLNRRGRVGAILGSPRPLGPLPCTSASPCLTRAQLTTTPCSCLVHSLFTMQSLPSGARARRASRCYATPAERATSVPAGWTQRSPPRRSARRRGRWWRRGRRWAQRPPPRLGALRPTS